MTMMTQKAAAEKRGLRYLRRSASHVTRGAFTREGGVHCKHFGSSADSGEVSLIVRKPTWRRDTVIVCGVETPHTRLLPCAGPNSLSGNKQWTIEHPLINTRIYLVTLASKRWKPPISVTSSLVKDFKRDLTNIQLIQSPFSVLQACGCESELSVTPLETVICNTWGKWG